MRGKVCVICHRRKKRMISFAGIQLCPDCEAQLRSAGMDMRTYHWFVRAVRSALFAQAQ